MLLFLHEAQGKKHTCPAFSLHCCCFYLDSPLTAVFLPAASLPTLPPSVFPCPDPHPDLFPLISSSTRDSPRSAPCGMDQIPVTHSIDSQVSSDVWGCDLMEQGSPCHSPQQLGSHVEGSSKKGHMAAHQAGHSHGRVDVGPADVCQSLHKGADSQAKGYGNLQHRGHVLWPVEG